MSLWVSAFRSKASAAAAARLVGNWSRKKEKRREKERVTHEIRNSKWKNKQMKNNKYQARSQLGGLPSLDEPLATRRSRRTRRRRGHNKNKKIRKTQGRWMRVCVCVSACVDDTVCV